MPKPQPYRLPTRFDSATFIKHAIPGEPIVIVKAMGVGSTSPFEFSDRNGRQAIFRFEMKHDGHVLRVPASIWNANKGAMAHDLMEQRRLPLPLVVLVEITPACGPQQTISKEVDNAIQGQRKEPPVSQDMETQNQGLVLGVQEDVEVRNVRIQPPSSIAFPSQTGQEEPCQQDGANELQQGNDCPRGSEMPSAVRQLSCSDSLRAGSPIPKVDTATTSPETGATVTSDNAPNVVGQGEEPPVAPSSETVSSQGESDSGEAHILAPGGSTPPPDTTSPAASGRIMHKDKPMHSAAWDLLEKPTRIKAVAALLETDEATLKAAIEDPESRVELGHAGWVKRREPQA